MVERPTKDEPSRLPRSRRVNHFRREGISKSLTVDYISPELLCTVINRAKTTPYPTPQHPNAPTTVLGQLGRTVEQSVLWRTPLIFCMRKAKVFASLVKALAVGQPSYFAPSWPGTVLENTYSPVGTVGARRRCLATSYGTFLPQPSRYPISFLDRADEASRDLPLLG